MLRFLTAGESHGPALSVIVEGLPAGLPVDADEIADELARRRLGYGRGPRMRFERDELRLTGGVRHGRTLGGPIAVEIANSEWPKWQQEMAATPGRPERRLTQPRPGHADLVGMQKYGFDDARDVLERASARETAARVVAGSLAKSLLGALDVAIVSHVTRIGQAATPDGLRPTPSDLARVDENEVRCLDPVTADAMIVEIKAAAKDGDSLGGVAEVIGYGVPVGLGSHVHWDRKLDGLLAGALMSIPAVKAVEIGDGLALAALRGSVAHDSILREDASERTGGYVRASDHAGGLEGGITSGAPLIARVAMKPLSTLNRPVLATVDVDTGESALAFKERTDVVAVPALGVIAESMMALVVAGEALRKFGGLGDRVFSQRERVPGASARLSERSAHALVPPRCVLVGLPGSGKSVVARRVARRLGVPVTDTDRMLGGPETIAAVWRSEGESAFRVHELDVLARALTADGVVATGGGVVTTPEGRQLLRDTPCVWLRASPEYLARRATTRHRPVLGDDALATLTDLAAQRSAWYEEVARETVDASRSLADVVNDVVLIVMGWDACV